ncbi:MAG: type II toxin-antitoxin system RelE/ParE family toxin [bacterium]|nr:type II toxin-antitoxin system RelE/ParE family toxin [bacterium]
MKNSLGSWELRIDPAVLKFINKLPQKDVRRIRAVVYSLPLNPYYGDLEKMEGYDNVWRRRVGSYRIFYRLVTKDKIISIFNLERRSSKTYS